MPVRFVGVVERLDRPRDGAGSFGTNSQECGKTLPIRPVTVISRRRWNIGSCIRQVTRLGFLRWCRC